MSAATKNVKMRYASNGVYGSLAYDLDRLNTAEAPAYAPGVKSAPRRKSGEKVRVRAQALAAPKIAFSPFAVIGYAVSAVMLVLVLFSYIKLNDISNEANVLNEQLNGLLEEETKLQIRHESVFNLYEVEEYAKNTLGMVKADGSQIQYVNSSASDKAVILSNDGGEMNILDRILKIISNAVEYLK